MALLELPECVVRGGDLLLLGHSMPLVGDLASHIPAGDSCALGAIGYVCSQMHQLKHRGEKEELTGIAGLYFLAEERIPTARLALA